ncbi:hypothetical protein C5S30_02980 [ANME-1 cluster archaeon GoMg4]|nr:hypothetical protein [ANME-1 cluster archaeon GoMg4]
MSNGNIDKLVALLKTEEEEEEIRNIVLAEKKPIIAEEVAKKTSGRFKSLRYTTHTLRTLDSLTRKGVLGKFKRDRFYYFTTPKEAVMQALKKRSETPEECSPNEIAKETGMLLYVVLDVIAELLP